MLLFTFSVYLTKFLSILRKFVYTVNNNANVFTFKDRRGWPVAFIRVCFIKLLLNFHKTVQTGTPTLLSGAVAITQSTAPLTPELIPIQFFIIKRWLRRKALKSLKKCTENLAHFLHSFLAIQRFSPHFLGNS